MPHGSEGEAVQHGGMANAALRGVQSCLEVGIIVREDVNARKYNEARAHLLNPIPIVGGGA
jgi:hypothetical protein